MGNAVVSERALCQNVVRDDRGRPVIPPALRDQLERGPFTVRAIRPQDSPPTSYSRQTSAQSIRQSLSPARPATSPTRRSPDHHAHHGQHETRMALSLGAPVPADRKSPPSLRYSPDKALARRLSNITTGTSKRESIVSVVSAETGKTTLVTQRRPSKAVAEVPPRVQRQFLLDKGRLHIVIHPGEVTLRGNGLSNSGKRIKTPFSTDGRSLPYVGGSSAMTGVQCAPPVRVNKATAETRAVLLLQKVVRGWLCRRAIARRLAEERERKREASASAERMQFQRLRSVQENIQRRRDQRESRRRDWVGGDQDDAEPEELTIELGEKLLDLAEETRLAAKRVQEEVDRQMELVFSGTTEATHNAPRIVLISDKMPMHETLRDAVLQHSPDGSNIITITYSSENETPDSLIATILDTLKANASYSRAKSLCMLVPCEPGMCEVLFGMPTTSAKLFKDASLQRMWHNIGQLVSKVDRAEARIHFLASGYLAGGEHGDQLLTALRKFSNVTAECPVEMSRDGQRVLGLYLSADRLAKWRREIVRQHKFEMGILNPLDEPRPPSGPARRTSGRRPSSTSSGVRPSSSSSSRTPPRSPATMRGSMISSPVTMRGSMIGSVAGSRRVSAISSSAMSPGPRTSPASKRMSVIAQSTYEF
eukprot:m.237139 g.237139  ORF g.237139 m.237139 type:complete len:650 (+) comp13088_c0_seq1:98-2047(+)